MKKWLTRLGFLALAIAICFLSAGLERLVNLGLAKVQWVPVWVSTGLPVIIGIVVFVQLASALFLVATAISEKQPKEYPSVIDTA